MNVMDVARVNGWLDSLTAAEQQLINRLTNDLVHLKLLPHELISAIRSLFTVAESTPVSPIILDLDGDGIETIGVNAGAYFDHDGNGFAESTGWVGADDGLLVWDRNGDGRINDGKELFGSETILSSGAKAANGYAALAELDTNADGKIDISDAAFANLKVWKDLDGDGYSVTGELFNLADVGVQSINTGATSSTYVDPNGNAHKLTGSFTKTDGSTGAVADVWFQTDPLYTIQEEYLAVPTDIAALPDLRGYGNVYDLQQAMVRDASGGLKTLIESFVAETNPGDRSALLDQILFKWTGVDAVNPASRGSYIDARRLAFMEKLFGQSFVGSDGSPNPAYNVGPVLDQTYQGLSEMFYAQTMAQTHLKPLYDQIAYSWDTVSQSIKGDLSAVTITIQTQLDTAPELGWLTLGEFSRTIKALQAQTTLDFAAFRSAFAAQGAEFGIIIDAAGANSFYGTSVNDVLTGTVGTDYLAGMAGDDMLNGGSGDNAIYGGLGNDYLEGSAGADTYLFNRGDGQDAILDNPYEYAAARADRVVFGAGITRADLTVHRSGYHLVLDIADPGNPQALDRLTLQYWYADSTPYCRIETLAFADGTTLGIADLNALAATGTEAADTLTGWRDEAQTFRGFGGNDTIAGSDGADTLEGGYGNDAIAGGEGNDVLNGWLGNDTYSFGRGDGQDVVNDYDTAVGNADTANIGDNRLNIVFSRSGNDLVMSLHGGADALRVQSWYSGAAYQTETIRASDGSTLINTQVEQLIQAMATFSAQNGGITWDQAIDQRPDDVQAILAANWIPSGG